MKTTNKLLSVCAAMLSLLASQAAHSQCLNNTSTNPKDPRNPGFLPWADSHLPGGPFSINPFLNTFDWEYPYKPIYIEKDAGFNIGGVAWINNQFPMLSPFNTGLRSSSAYNAAFNSPAVDDRDYKWADGWELLWLNTGRTPDETELYDKTPGSPLPDPQSAAPSNIPYFVLYNKYRGMVRLFANVWFDASKGRYETVSAALTFANPAIVNGLLRHTGSYDTPLDQFTRHQYIQGPSSHPLNADQWMLADFQVGFDPCICTRNEARLIFEFKTIDNMTLEMSSRSISIDKKLENLDFLKEDFMNLDDVDEKMDKPGSRIYKEMGSMVEAYERALDKYESELDDYNSPEGVLKRSLLKAVQSGLGSVGGIVGSGVAGSIISNKPLVDFVLRMKPKLSVWSDALIDLDTKNANDFASSVVGGTKSTIASGFDFLSSVIEVPGKPVKPAAPTASFTETNYKGTLTSKQFVQTNELLVPGANSSLKSNGIDRLNYPAYNESLGLFALLKTPKVQVKKTRVGGKVLNRDIRENVELVKTACTNNYCIKLDEPLLFRFNRAADMNMDKTKLYYSYRITFKKKKLVSDNGINDNHFDMEPNLVNKTIASPVTESFTEQGVLTAVISTPFVEVSGALNEPQCFTNDYVFDFIFGRDPEYPNNHDLFALNISRMDADEIDKIELKLMADMYFNGKGSLDQEMSTMQVFTYLVYKKEADDKQEPQEDTHIGNVLFKAIPLAMLKHKQGTLVLDNVHLSPASLSAFPFSQLLNGNELHLLTENVTLKNNITVEPGYVAYIHYLGAAYTLPEAALFPELVLQKISGQELYGQPLIQEATDTEVEDFCKSGRNLYRSNQPLLAKKDTLSVEQENPRPRLHQVEHFRIYPNPATRGETTVSFTLSESTSVHLVLYDLTGKKCVDLGWQTCKEGAHSIPVNLEELPGGIYFCKLATGNGEVQMHKIVIAK